MMKKFGADDGNISGPIKDLNSDLTNDKKDQDDSKTTDENIKEDED